MNLLEQALDYPWGDTLPTPGASLTLAPGIRWVRMGLPFALDHINLWLLRDEIDGREGWTVVDCCVNAASSQAQWETIFKEELDGLPVLRVLATHMHPDHIGLASWLCELWRAPLWISATEYQTARLALLGQGSFGGTGTADFFALHGLTDAVMRQELLGRVNYYASMVPALPAAYRRLMDGEEILIGGRRWRCISGYGHSPEHMALYCNDAALPTPVLISGDMVLPRISTNISVYELEPEANPLRLFLDSLGKFEGLADNTLTLPSHGKPFRGLHERIRQLQDHHRDRLDEVVAACSQAPCSASEILPVMFKRQLDLHQTTFAMGEALAHLHCLWLDGKLSRALSTDGVLRFSCV